MIVFEKQTIEERRKLIAEGKAKYVYFPERMHIVAKIIHLAPEGCFSTYQYITSLSDHVTEDNRTKPFTVDDDNIILLEDSKEVIEYVNITKFNKSPNSSKQEMMEQGVLKKGFLLKAGMVNWNTEDAYFVENIKIIESFKKYGFKISKCLKEEFSSMVNNYYLREKKRCSDILQRYKELYNEAEARRLDHLERCKKL